jgi:secretion/DNA translocation related TadE-like protein
MKPRSKRSVADGRRLRLLQSDSARGSTSVALAAALAFAAILAAFTADVSRASGARARAQAAADAAALAAAQELFIPSSRHPADVASEYAERNGAELVECRCDAGTTEAVVTVVLRVDLPLVAQTRSITASARAVVAAPPGSEGLQPEFAAALACLFDRVEGLTIVSGFRTREEQAALHRLKPGLAAPPGHSMHEVGLAADLAFASPRSQTEAHREVAGCGLHFPISYEPWHVEPLAA